MNTLVGYRSSAIPKQCFFADRENILCPCAGAFCWMAHRGDIRVEKRSSLDVSLDAFRHICVFLPLSSLLLTVQGVCRAWARVVILPDLWEAAGWDLQGLPVASFVKQCFPILAVPSLPRMQWLPNLAKQELRGENMVPCSSNIMVKYGPIAMEGVWIFEMTFITTNPETPSGSFVHHPCAIGVTTVGYSSGYDAEYEKGFFGLYHGGSSINVIADGTRTFRHIPPSDAPPWKSAEEKTTVGVCVDMNSRSLRCMSHGKIFPEKYTLQAGTLPRQIHFSIWLGHGWQKDILQIHVPKRVVVEI